MDEAQDVNTSRADLIMTLQQTCKHLVLAGDPRLSMDVDSTWFADVWRDESFQGMRKTLRYNHRSTPQIVQFLNEFSKRNFTDCGLHVEQLSCKGSVSMPTARKFLEAHEKDKHGHVIAQYLLESTDPEQAYAITPVTTEKWKIGDITSDVQTNIRQKGHTTKVIKNLAQSEEKQKKNDKKKPIEHRI